MSSNSSSFVSDVDAAPRHANVKHCRNCGHAVNDRYCAHCGQKANIERITFSYLSHEVFHFFTHIEKGFLFTSLRMVTAPGVSVKNFVAGQRRNYQPPVSYFLVWTTVYILTLLGIEKLFGANAAIDYKNYFGPQATTRYAITHLNAVLAVVVPFHALYLFLLFTRGTYNFFETAVGSIYCMGTIILMQFVFAVIALVTHALSGATLDLRISDAFKIGYLTWFVVDYSKMFSVRYRWLRCVVFLVLAFGTFTAWRLYGIPALLNH